MSYKHAVDFNSYFRAFRDNEMTLQDLGAHVSASLFSMIRNRMSLEFPHHPFTGEFNDATLKQLYYDFAAFYHDPKATAKQFNALYDRVLDWCEAHDVYIYV